MNAFRSLALLAALALPLSGCDGDVAQAGVSTLYLEAIAEAAPDTVDVPVSRRLWTADDNLYFKCGGPSPDGRLISLVDYRTGDLAVYDVEGDSTRRVTDKGSWEENESFAECSTFSPDGARLAFSYFRIDETRRAWPELRVVDVGEAAESRVLVRSSDPRDVIEPMDWNREGILGIGSEGSETTLVIVDPDDGAVRVVHRGPKFWGGAVFSPDGRTIAYGEADEIRLVDVDGENDRPSTVRWGRIVGWSKRDGNLYYVDRTGDLLALPFDERGDPQTPRVVRPDVAGYGVGASDEAIFIGVPVDAARVHVVRTDVDGRPVGEPTPVSRLEAGSSHGAAWSPDGRTLAYVQRPPRGRLGDRIVLATPDGDEIRALPPLEAGIGPFVRWGGAGQSLWYVARGDSTVALWRYDLRSGESAKVLEPGGRPFDVDPRREVVYQQRKESENGPLGIYAYDAGTEALKLLVATPLEEGQTTVAVSPDGGSLAYASYDPDEKKHRLMVLPLGGGEPREIHRIDADSPFTPFAFNLEWSADGSSIRYRRLSQEGGTVLESVPVGGGPPTELARYPKDSMVRHVRINPAGGLMAFEDGIGESELWMVELAKGKAGPR